MYGTIHKGTTLGARRCNVDATNQLPDPALIAPKIAQSKDGLKFSVHVGFRF